jgi:hypothetical protein
MATFGIEAIRHFSHARAAGYNVGDLTYTFNRSNGLRSQLLGSGHTQQFYYADTSCWETDLRDNDQGGSDRIYADKVDLFWIETHGGNDNGSPILQYDIEQKKWQGSAKQWQLGENTQGAEWIMAYSCNTTEKDKVGGLWNIFAGLHLYCGAYESMYDGPTTDECGEDVGDNLTDGETVCESWIDGVSDWWLDNHPIVVCSANAFVYNNGNIRWNQSYLNCDHLWGHGMVLPDPIVSQQVRLLYRWSEG